MPSREGREPPSASGPDGWFLRPAGERSWLVELGEAADPWSTPAAVAGATRREAARAGIDLEQVVPGASTVLVTAARSEPQAARRSLPALLDRVRATLADQANQADRSNRGPGHSEGPAVVTIEVVYEGADLEAVAAEAGLSVEEVVARHTAGRYQAAFTGFAPGFAYLTGLDPRLWVGRRHEARPVVPAGSVAVADRYTAVYPRATPGGWRLLGWTAARIWDPDRLPPALLEPGAQVRFLAVRPAAAPPAATPLVAAPPAAAPAAAAARGAGAGRSAAGLFVVTSGPLTSVQDGGRPGHAHQGVPASGAVDRRSWALANRLVGNIPSAAVLELTLLGPVLRLDGPPGSTRTVAVTGADADIRVGGRPGSLNAPLRWAVGEELRIGPLSGGIRSYVAVSGGIEMAPVLGSQSYDQLSGLGPGPLTGGQKVPLGPPDGGPSGIDVAPVRPRALPLNLRILPGPRRDWFTDDAWVALTSAAWVVRPESNRVGLRLDGPPLERAIPGELAPEGMVTGAIQVPTSGAPVLFLADHPVTGGYPVMAVVVDDDQDLAAQAGPGTPIFFTAVSVTAART